MGPNTLRQNYPKILEWTGLSEGGYVNHPKDPGGATDRGITQRTFDAWNRAKGLPQKPVKGISKDTAEEIIASQYLDTVRADILPPGLDYAVGDYSVNSGPSRSVMDLQRTLGVTPDGIIGNHTLAAIREADVQQVIIDLCERRLRFMKSLKTWPTFGKGWRRRVMGGTDGVQEFDIGVIDRAWRMAHNLTNIPAPKPTPGRAEGQPDWLTAIINIIKGFLGKGQA
jgi:lysozyme family protein